MMKKLFGVTTAMVTPFCEDGAVDYKAVEELTKMLVEKGVNCLYPCGTTGEMLHLSTEERKKIAETVVKAADKKVTVFIHVGAVCQSDTIELAQHAEKIGADGIGVVTPVFFGVTDREMEEYYVAVAKSVSADFPIYLYNIPQCAANDLKTEVVKKVANRCSNVVGIKYSFADVSRTVEYLTVKNGDFSVLHGCDKILTSLLAMGCDGTVSGVSGVFPEPFVAVYKAYQEGNIELAQKEQAVCVKLCDALKCGSNMSYFKEGLKLRGLNGGFMRKPQLDIEQSAVLALKEELTAICEKTGYSLKL